MDLRELRNDNYIQCNNKTCVKKILKKTQKVIMLFEYYEPDDIVLVNGVFATLFDITYLCGKYPLIKLVVVNLGYPEYKYIDKLSIVYETIKERLRSNKSNE